MFTGRSSTSGLYDELVDAHGVARPAAAAIVETLEQLGPEELVERQRAAGVEIDSAGVTFTVYSDGVGIDRSWPFDVVPRVIARSEWDRIEAGLLQRLTALNHFIADVYGERRILAAGLVPAEIVLGSRDHRPECIGVRPAHDVWAHICGSDLVRDADGTMYVLEDNLRVPSGVSYVLENRATTKRVFSELFANQSILPVDAYPERLRRILASLCPHRDDPVIAVLTPGIYNSAYFEHSFLARAMGIPLVEGRDMYVDERDRVMLRTVEGPVQVDVIYRRVDDVFLDPEVFRPDSTLGTPGLMRAWRAGNVALANAPGTGVADDKVVYSYVPDMIRYYLDEEPLLTNVPTFRCGRDDDRAYVLDHLAELVVKPANESGGYGIVIGPAATTRELEEAAAAIRADPDNYVAQPVVQLSTVPTLCDGTLEARHVDLRPFTLLGGESYVTCGGLTRVARTAGSLVVNSSQGGGSKDTWIVDTATAPADVLPPDPSPPEPSSPDPSPTAAIDLTDPERE
ncbi:MAG: circularly permuted type 2 ATP-grasp protein [Actinomycetota bacterium]|nr:circularly permuted type 2 ATP-grasp protein [Actinomycetota bacterium]